MAAHNNTDPHLTRSLSSARPSLERGERLDPARVRGLIATNVGASVAFAAMYSTQPVLPQIGRDFHVDAATAGLTLLAVTFALAFASLSAGRISDHFGSRRVMLVCCVILTALSALAAIAPTFGSLVTIRAAQGLVIPGITISGLAYLHNDLPASWRGRVSGFYIGTNTLGGLVGRLGVGLLVDTITWRGGLAVIAGFVALGALILVFGMPRSAPSAQLTTRREAAAPDTSLRVIAARLWWAPLIGATVFFPFLCIFTYTPYRLEGAPFYLSPGNANLFYLVYILGAIASLVAGQVSDRIGRRSTIYLGLAVCAFGLILSLLDFLPTALLALAFVCVGGLSSHVVANASVSDGANPLGAGARATALSLYTMGFYIGGGLGAFIPGFGWERWGWPGVIAPCAVALIFASLCALKTPLRPQRPAAPGIEPAAAP
ncbi:MAG TPA: MFS transporter [Ktedonobacterales bacterium]|nr:MFS transporter [Ktedonobacterales bacterium]